jgi:cytochrome c peroxidase
MMDCAIILLLRQIPVTLLVLLAGSAVGTPMPSPPEIPKPGPAARPKPLAQLGAPANLTRAVIPKDNPQTPEKVVLGERLFFDGRLSSDGTVACASCHDPERPSRTEDLALWVSKVAWVNAMPQRS